MQLDALDKWGVPAIISVLPVLLLIAVLLFFAGIFELLLHAGHIQVVLPIGIVMGATILFLILTTTLPTLQMFLLYHANRLGTKTQPESIILDPCPYLSPQSNIFRDSMMHWEIVFKITSRVWRAINIATSHCLCRKDAPSELSSITSLIAKQKVQIFAPWRLKGAEERRERLDVTWMLMRDIHSQASYTKGVKDTDEPDESELQLEPRAGWYDMTRGICHEIINPSLFDMQTDPLSFNFASYHCALSYIFEFPQASDGKVSRFRYLAKHMGYRDDETLDHFRGRHDDADSEDRINTLREEATFILLYAIRDRLELLGTPFRPITIRLAESYLRLVGRIFMADYQQNCDFGAVEKLPVLFRPVVLFSGMETIYESATQPFTWKWAGVLDTYFRELPSIRVDTEILKRTLPVHRFFRQFTYNFWRQLRCEINEWSEQERTVKQVISTLRFIKEKLEDDKELTTDVFFWSAAYHIQFYRKLKIEYTEKGDIEEDIDAVIWRLRRIVPRLPEKSPTKDLLMEDARKARVRDYERGTSFEFESYGGEMPTFSNGWLTSVLGEGSFTGGIGSLLQFSDNNVFAPNDTSTGVSSMPSSFGDMTPSMSHGIGSNHVQSTDPRSSSNGNVASSSSNDTLVLPEPDTDVIIPPRTPPHHGISLQKVG